MNKSILAILKHIPMFGKKIRRQKDYNYMMSSMEKAELSETGELDILREWERLNPTKVLTPEVVKHLLTK